MIGLHKIGESAQLLEIGPLINSLPPLEVLEHGVAPDQLSKLIQRAESVVSLRTAGLLKVDPEETNALNLCIGMTDLDDPNDREAANRRVLFTHQTAHDYLINRRHGKTTIIIEILSFGTIYRNIAQCRLAAARCFDLS